MLDTKYLYQFTSITEYQIKDKASRYMVNHKYREEKCSLSNLFKSLYCSLYNIEGIKIFKVV